MNELQLAIWTLLLKHFAGPENAAPRVTIISRYNLVNRVNLEDRTFRRVVSELVVDFKKPICTISAGSATKHGGRASGAGYYVARTTAELEHGVADLESRGAAIFERARALRETIPLERQERLF